MKQYLTNGKIKVGACTLPGRKLPSLFIEEENKITVIGHFNSKEDAELFVDKLAEIVGRR